MLPLPSYNFPPSPQNDWHHCEASKALPVSAPMHSLNDFSSYFNSRSPRGERRCPEMAGYPGPYISIHAPLAGSDLGHLRHWHPADVISIHAPLAGSDIGSRQNLVLRKISIHAPLAGSDDITRSHVRLNVDFNPRSPRGERRSRESSCSGRTRFQSTLPSRGATGDAGRRIG